MKILVIQQKMIGDVLISSIICNNLRKAYPKAQIDYLVYEATTPVLEGNSSIDNIILFQEKQPGWKAGAAAARARLLRKEHKKTLCRQ